MPRTNGLEFLERLMRLRPTRVVMVPLLTAAGATTTLRALELGAIDSVLKPTVGIENGVLELAADLTAKVRTAAIASVRRYVDPPPRAVTRQAGVAGAHASLSRSDDSIIVIGASTGGTEAVKDVLVGMPPNAPPILVMQHMPPGFTRSFAERLDRCCAIDVCEAASGMRLLTGRAYIAPGSAHLSISRRGSVGYTSLDDGPPVNRLRPSVDVLFESAAQTDGKRVVASILTGTGRDGALGLTSLHRAGAFTIAQIKRRASFAECPKRRSRRAAWIGSSRSTASRRRCCAG